MAAARFLSLLSAALLALSGCTQRNSASTPDTPVNNSANGTQSPAYDVPAPSGPTDCNADKAGSFIGREATPQVRVELEEAVAPVRTIRWVGPGDATTEDYSPSRLNVMFDVSGTIRSAHCG